MASKEQIQAICNHKVSLAVQKLEYPGWTFPKVLLVYWPARHGHLHEAPVDDIEAEEFDDDKLADRRADALCDSGFCCFYLTRKDK